MEFLKKHYEKIILSLVLIGLAVVAVRLPLAMSEAKEELENPTGPTPKPKAAAPFDFSPEQTALNELTNPPKLVLSGDNNTFNPVIWKMRSDGQLIKITKEGPAALTITKISPLYLTISFDNAATGGAGYYLSVQQYSEKKSKEYAKINQKPGSGLYILRAVKGTNDNPEALQLELPDTQQTVWITKDKPYQRIDGFTADLKYPAAEPMLKKRVGDVIKLEGESYKIIEITQKAVRVESSTAKQTQIDWNGAPALESSLKSDNSKP